MTSARLSAPAERDLAIRRRRRLTAGTLAGAVAAVGGVAYVAAATLPGHSAAAAASSPGDLSGGDSSTITPADDPGLQPPGQAPGYGGPGGGAAQSGGS